MTQQGKCRGGTDKNHENCSQDLWPLNRGLLWDPPNNMERFLMFQLTSCGEVRDVYSYDNNDNEHDNTNNTRRKQEKVN